MRTGRTSGNAEAAPPPLVVIAGATATGKTELSLALADAIGEVEIISADSRQVYRGMDVGTAKVSPADRARVPHHGLDLVDPDEPFSVAEFQRHALAALGGIAARGRTAILVGGTGLYLRAVARGFDLRGGRPDPDLRRDLERRLEQEGLGALAAELRRIAPGLAAATDLANPRRVIRALERARVHGDQPPPPPAGYPGRVLWLGLQLDPALHRERIAGRAAAQFSGGLLDETAELLHRYPADLPAFSALGYREAVAHLLGEVDLATAIGQTVARTWAYARRQRTWFRAEPGIEWLGAGEERDRALAVVQRFLDTGPSGPAPLSAGASGRTTTSETWSGRAPLQKARPRRSTRT